MQIIQLRHHLSKWTVIIALQAACGVLHCHPAALPKERYFHVSHKTRGYKEALYPLIILARVFSLQRNAMENSERQTFPVSRWITQHESYVRVLQVYASNQ